MVGDLHSQQIPVQQASLGCGRATDSHYECAADKSGLALCFEMLTFTHIHTQMDASKNSLVSCPRIHADWPTFQSVDDLVYRLSNSHPIQCDGVRGADHANVGQNGSSILLNLCLF